MNYRISKDMPLCVAIFLGLENISCFASSVDYVEMETQTNPIDRSVAHLLFHRAPESTTVSLDTTLLESHMMVTLLNLKLVANLVFIQCLIFFFFSVNFVIKIDLTVLSSHHVSLVTFLHERLGTSWESIHVKKTSAQLWSIQVPEATETQGSNIVYIKW